MMWTLLSGGRGVGDGEGDGAVLSVTWTWQPAPPAGQEVFESGAFESAAEDEALWVEAVFPPLDWPWARMAEIAIRRMLDNIFLGTKTLLLKIYGPTDTTDISINVKK